MSWELIAGSCLHSVTGLASLGDESVDHAFFDGPYAAHVHSSFMHGLTASNKIGEKGKFAEKTSLGFNHLTMATLEGVAAEAARVTRKWVGAFSDVESCHLWREAFERYGLDYIRTVLWNKLGGAPQFTGDRPAVGFECITLAHRPGRKSWNGGGKRGVYEIPWLTPDIYTHSIVLRQRGKERRAHSTQKPEALMEAIIRDFTQPGETVIDPFAGFATTGVACVRNGRHFVGWELDPAMAELARERLSETREQVNFFQATDFKQVDPWSFYDPPPSRPRSMADESIFDYAGGPSVGVPAPVPPQGEAPKSEPAPEATADEDGSAEEPVTQLTLPKSVTRAQPRIRISVEQDDGTMKPFLVPETEIA